LPGVRKGRDAQHLEALAPIDWIGFALISIAFGTLEVVLDKGERFNAGICPVHQSAHSGRNSSPLHPSVPDRVAAFVRPMGDASLLFCSCG
jgi:hypothetical protein